MGILATLYYFAGSSLIHLSLHSNAWDLGVFAQVIYNTAHGRLFAYSFRPYPYLADHFSPILLLLAPLGYIKSALPLLFVQAAALGGAAVVLYFLARKFISSAALIYLIVLAFIFNPFVLQAVNFDFHPDVFLPLLGFLSLYFLAGNRRFWSFVCFLLFLSVREDSFLAFLPIIFAAFFYLKSRREAVLMFLGGLLYFLAVNLYFLPSLRYGLPSPLSEHYGYLGRGFRPIVLNILANPLIVAAKLLGRAELFSFFKFFLGSGFMILLTPAILLSAAPILLVRLLSAETWSLNLLLHYGIQLVLPISLGLILSVSWLEKKLPRVGRAVLVTYLVLITLINFIVFSPWPTSLQTGLDLSRFTVTTPDRRFSEIQKLIPSDAAVSAQSALVPHLAFRQKIYEFPRLEDAEYVVLDERGIISQQSLSSGYYRVKENLRALGFNLIKSEDGFLVYQR